MDLMQIRRRLLLLALMALSACGLGAAVQAWAMREHQQRFNAIRADFVAADALDRIAYRMARERGRTLMLLRTTPPSDTDAAELGTARVETDAALRDAQPPGGLPLLPFGIDQLATLRAGADRRSVASDALYERYSALVALVNEGAASRLGGGMVEVGVRHEHLNAKRDAIEHLARSRGLMAAAIARGSVDARQREKILRERILFDAAMRRYLQTQVPGEGDHALLMRLPALAAMRAQWSAFDADPAACLAATNGDAWWAEATSAVDAYQRSLLADALIQRGAAQAVMARTETNDRWTLAALASLGMFTAGLAFPVVARPAR